MVNCEYYILSTNITRLNMNLGPTSILSHRLKKWKEQLWFILLSTRTNSKLTCFTPAGKLPNYFVVHQFREQHKTFAPLLLGNHSCICVSWSEIIFSIFYFDQLVVGRNTFLCILAQLYLVSDKCWTVYFGQIVFGQK